MKSCFCALLAALVLCAPLSRAQDKFADVARQVQPFVDRGEIAGAVMLLATKDRILFQSAVGVSDLATQRPMETGDTFWIASMSKPITALAVAILVATRNNFSPITRTAPSAAPDFPASSPAPQR